jgi:DNA phosphorothioation-dependent restriction protein DptH
MRTAYASKGIDIRGDQPARDQQEYPDFSAVGVALQSADERAYGRLDPLFDLDLFRPRFCATPFHELLGRAVVLDLSQLPSDEIKAALARIFLISAHGYYNPREHSSGARQFFVFDEAHRMKDEPKLDQFVRECRAYGVGVIISSQYPTDFSREVSAALATKLAHGNGADAARVRGIVNLLGMNGHERAVADLQQFEVVAQSSRFGPSFVRSLHYPALAALRFLCAHPGGSTDDEVALAPGLDQRKTRQEVILKHLAAMRFAQRGPDDFWRASAVLCQSLP